MTPLMIFINWLPIVGLSAAWVAAFCAAILVTRYMTNAQWKRDLAKNMPANVREQLAIRDHRIEEQEKELQEIRAITRQNGKALRAIQALAFEATDGTMIRIEPTTYSKDFVKAFGPKARS